ncbi:MAG: hypothetical protein WC821_02805 [archaeon]|jgi:hypothetical protein
MHKGQIFSTDFLFAMALIIMGFGVLASVGEFNLYNTKQKTEFSLLKERAETGIITFANSPKTSCDFNGTSLAYSINTAKIAGITSADRKKLIALQDGNVTLSLTTTSTTQYLTDSVNYENLISFDVNVLVCDKNINYYDLNLCMTTASCPNLQRGTLNLKVGK